MTGRADSRQEMSDLPLALSATINMLPSSGDNVMLNRVYESIGHKVSYKTFPADEAFPSWGESKCDDLTIEENVRLRDLLNQIYVFIPVFDRRKH